jgi:hypothetical protein
VARAQRGRLAGRAGRDRNRAGWPEVLKSTIRCRSVVCRRHRYPEDRDPGIAAIAVRMLAMGYRARAMTLAVASVSIVAVAVWLVYAVWRSPHRNDLSVFWAFAIPAGVAAASLSTWIWRVRTGQREATVGAAEAASTNIVAPLASSTRTMWVPLASTLRHLPLPPR